MQDSILGPSQQHRKFFLPFLLLTTLILFVLPVEAQSRRPKSQPISQQGLMAPPANAQYVGSDTCKTCHEDIYTKHFEGTPHFSLITGGKHGCEDCHGPGSAHVEGGGDVTKIISFKTLSAEQASRICLQCHSASKEQANFLRSDHIRAGVGCTSCHSPHNAKIVRSLLKDGQPQLCYSCHAVQKAEFSRPFRHRVNQGLIQCSDCHNPHGSIIPHQLRTSSNQDQVCFKCHTDVRGPFVYEHVPVKEEGCVACHMPHGSTNPRMLKVSQVNLLCLQCHTEALSDVPSQPPAGPVHNQSAKFQACTSCHVFIHGSNFSEVFFKP
jgi:DmsE family decaheme c-type cytochrome